MSDYAPLTKGEHTRPTEILSLYGEKAWTFCGCGRRIDIPVRNEQVNVAEVHALYDAHVAEVSA